MDAPIPADWDAFFMRVVTEKPLRARLSATTELVEVSRIARRMGYNISPADIVRIQSRRVFLLSPTTTPLVAKGSRMDDDLQWGRKGCGYLNRPGYWMLRMWFWGIRFPEEHPEMHDFLSRVCERRDWHRRLCQAKNVAGLYKAVRRMDWNLKPDYLMHYNSYCLMRLTDRQAARVARGQIENWRVFSQKEKKEPKIKNLRQG